LDDATHDGEVAADKAIDLLVSETLETAFVEAVPAKEEVSATPITLPKEDPDGINDTKEADQKAAGEVQSVAAEAVKDSDQPTMERAAAETAPETSTARTVESQKLPEDMVVERDSDEPKLVIRDADGDDGGLKMDEGLDQVTDFKEPNQVTGQYGDEGDPAKGDVSYQGDPAHAAEGILEIPGMDKDLMGVMTGKGGGKEVDAGLPGMDQDGERGDLADAAAPGGDANVGIGTLQTIAGVVYDFIGGGSQDSGSSGSAGTRGTPDPEGGVGEEFDDTLGGLVPGILPDDTPDDLGAESLMQPVDEDSDSPKEPGIAFDRATQTDPYRQDTDEYVDLPKIVPDGEVDPDGNLIDPPGFSGGEPD